MGRVTAGNQNTGGTAYSFSYAYNRLDGLTSMTYPSTRTVTYGYDGAGRANSVTNYVTGVTYHPHGAPSVTTLGNGVVETARYNDRLQPYQMEAVKSGNSLWKQENFYCAGEAGSCSSNNGNMISQKLTAPKTLGGTLVLATALGYDTVNRITTAAETGSGTAWSQSFNFGSNQFGNLTQTGDGMPSGLNCTSYDSTTNRCNASGFGHDAAGNLTSYGSRTLGYDAENRQKTLLDGSTTWSYEYDGEGRRVKKTGNGTTTVYVYDAQGRLGSEYDSTSLGNQPDCTTCFLTADHLGSTRLVTNEAGVVKRRYDYHPFGWEINTGYGDRSTVAGYATTDWSNPKFTGKPRDYESGLNLDFFGARYYGGAMGRFTSPDPLLSSGRPDDPQSWNRYTYGLNNPLRYTDPTGLYEWDTTLGGNLTDEDLKRNAGKNKVLRAQAQAIIDQRKAVRSELKHLTKSKDTTLQAAAGAIGREGVDNGVTISMGAVTPGAAAEVSFTRPLSIDANGNPELDLRIQPGAKGDFLFINLAHEGTHVGDAQGVAAGRVPFMRHIETEMHAYGASVSAARALGWSSVGPLGGSPFWNSS